MEEIILKKELEDLINLKGKVRGLGMKTHAEFIFKKEGEKGLKRLEDVVMQLGYPMKYEELKESTFYPLWMEGITLLAIKRLFNYNDEKFQEMGRFHTKLSFVIRFYMRYFSSVESVVKQFPRVWERYFTIGNPKIIEVNNEKKYVILRIENFRYHPLHCQIVRGMCSTIIEIILKTEGVCEETKCVHRGDEYHEFLLKW